MFDPPKRKQITSLADIVDPIREAEKKKRRDEMMLVLSKKSGGDATASDRQGQGVGDLASILDMGKSVGKFAAEMAPFSGEVLSGKDAYDQFSTGHPWLGALSTAGAVPGLGMGVRAAKKALGVADKVGDVARVAAKTVRGAKAGAKAGAAPALAKSLGKANADFNLAKGGDEMVDDAVEAIATEKKGHVGAEMASRDLPPAEALARAKAGMHLKLDNSGQYIGAPGGVGSDDAIAAMRANLDRLIAEGAPAHDWYERTRGDIERVFPGNASAQDELSQSLGMYSAQAAPPTNLGFSLKQLNAAQAGMPDVVPRMPAQAEKFNRWREIGKRMNPTPKTGVYENKINPTAKQNNSPVNDIWMGRVFGYKGADGGDWDQGFTSAQHAFMDAEMRLAVERANLNKVGGRSDWDLAKAQAAPWVYAKGMDLHQTSPGLYPTPEAGFAEANKTYGDFFERHAVNATYEAVPGKKTGHLTGMADQPMETREAFSSDPRGSWTDANGHDVGYKAVGAAQLPSRNSMGVYTNDDGITELNPGMVARPLGGIDNSGPERAIDAGTRALLETVEATRGFMDGQAASASHKLFPGKSTGGARSFTIPHNGPLDESTARTMSGMLKKEGFDLSDTGNGLSAMNANDAGGSGNIVDGNQLKKFLLGKGPTKKDPAGVPGFGVQIENALPGASGGITQGVMDGTYYPTGLDNLDDKGAATTQLLEQVDKFPTVRDNLGANPEMRAAVLSRVDRDIAHASALGLPIREALQNARRIFSEGGFEGLRAALKAGVVALPAAALILKREYDPSSPAGAPSPRGS